MARRWMLVGLATIGLTAATAASAALASSFLGAPAGVAVAFQSVPLPPVSLQRGLALVDASPFAPTLTQLLGADTVIRTEAQMRAIWNRLFDVPFDPSLFDFASDFVVLMGGGQLVLGSFDISSVERVDATWQSFFFGADVDPFLAVTSTLFLPGAFPQDPPPPTFRVSAVRVPKFEESDVVFHRAVIAAP